MLLYHIKCFSLFLFNFLKIGYRYMVFSNSTSKSSETSVFESPLYERFYTGHAVCVRFRYLMYGSGRRVLRLYQKLHLTHHTRRLMWAVNESNNTDGMWKYGRIAVPSVAKYRVRIIISFLCARYSLIFL